MSSEIEVSLDDRGDRNPHRDDEQVRQPFAEPPKTAPMKQDEVGDTQQKNETSGEEASANPVPQAGEKNRDDVGRHRDVLHSAEKA